MVDITLGFNSISVVSWEVTSFIILCIFPCYSLQASLTPANKTLELRHVDKVESGETEKTEIPDQGLYY